jgi:hypothetical protein
MKHNIFISWSGTRSRLVAEALHDWLPHVLQASHPWLSSRDIDKGTRGSVELAKTLEGLKIGISCLTPENLAAPWLLYEAGQLTKTLDPSTRLYTYLLDGLKWSDVEPPMGWFQHTDATKEDTLVLVQSINKAIADDPLSDSQVEATFELFWPALEKKLKTVPQTETGKMPGRTIEEMLAEILGLLRSDMATRADIRTFVDMLAPSPAVYGTVSQGTLGTPRNEFFFGPGGPGSRYIDLQALGRTPSTKSTEPVQPPEPTRNKPKL